MARRDQRIFRRKRSFSRFRGSVLWPIVMAGLSLGGLFLGYVFITKTAIPFFRRLVTDQRQVVMPTPTPNLVIDATERIREVLLTGAFRHVSEPVMLGNDIFFAAGSDNAQNPKLTHIYFAQTYVTSAAAPKQIEGIEAECDQILHLDVNADYIVYFDGYRGGGGLLKAYDRQAETVKTIANVDYGHVMPKLSGSKVVFLQRTSPTQEKIYCVDIQSAEVTTLHVYDNSPLGKYQMGVSGGDVVYAAESPATDSERYNMIYIVGFDGKRRSFDPGMYAYAPVTNARAIAFSDGAGQAGALYLSVEGAMQKKIAENVSGYGLGQNFLAWCEQGRIYAYFWQQDKTYRVSSLGEYAMLASVSDHGVMWFDITTEKRERDILKYAVLD